MKNLKLKLFASSIAAATLIAGCGASETVKAAPKASSSFADLAANNSKSIVATKTTEVLSGITSDSSLWSSAAFTNVALYPQTTVSFNDKKAIEMNKNNGAKTAKVAALVNGKTMAIAIIWKDSSENAHMGKTTDLYADGVAMQFASKVTDATKLPYIGMGSKGREVAIYLQKVQFNNYEPHGVGKGQARVETQVNRHQTVLFEKELAAYDKSVADLARDDFERKFVSAGFRSMTEIKDKSAKSKMNIARIDGYGWIATLTRPLTDEYADLSKSAPVAFAIWDGGKNNRNGTKLLSSWNVVTVPGAENKALTAAVTEVVKADTKAGRATFGENCAACHQAPGFTDVENDYTAPNLTNIGGYSTASYLRESIVSPDAVIVPGHNVNAHGGLWYSVEDGVRVSGMADSSAEGLELSKQDVENVVAYLQTLKAK